MRAAGALPAAAFALALALSGLPPAAAAQPGGARPDAEVCAQAQRLLRGAVGEALAGLEGARARLQAAGDRRGEALAGLFLGLAQGTGGQLDRCRESFEASAALLEQTGDAYGAWLSQLMLGQAMTLGRRLEQAANDLAAAQASLARIASGEARFSLDTFLAVALCPGADASQLDILNDPRLAPMLQPVFLALAEVLGATAQAALLIELGRLAEAEAALERARAHSGLLFGLLDTPLETRFGQLRRRQGRLEEARQHYRRAVAVAAADDAAEMAGLPTGGPGGGGGPVPGGAGLGSVTTLLPFLEISRIEALVGLAEVEALTGRFEASSREEIQRRLAEDTALIAYLVAADAVLAWVLTPHHFASAVLSVSEKALSERVAAGECEAIAADAPARDLYDQLLAPLEADLGGARRLILVPHGVLHELPFATLRDRENRALGERFGLLPGTISLCRRAAAAPGDPADG